MATIKEWNPFGVSLNVTATGSNVVRTSATQFEVTISASWETFWSSNKTNYGMTATSGGTTYTISEFNGTNRHSDSGTFKGTYSISGNGSQTKTIEVIFKNFNTDNGKSATKSVKFNVTVPAWTSYTVTYNANGGSGAPSSQTKWKDQTLILSTTRPTRTGYSFSKWNTNSSGTGTNYNSGGSYTANSGATLYAVWTANTYTIQYNANGGSGAPGNQTKTYGKTLTLSSTKPTRTNYNFLGWATSSTATKATYSEKTTLAYTTNSAATLYAVWELAYVKPRITNFSVARCDQNGEIIDDGTYAKVTFDWACDRTITSILIECLYGTRVMNSITLTPGGTSGSVSQTVGHGELNTETTYTIRVTVTDSVDSNNAYKNVYSLKFLIDCIFQNGGIAFGKAAEHDDVADFNFAIYPRQGFINIPLWEGADFNEIIQPNTYISSSTTAGTYANCPVTSGTFTLDVASAGAEGQVRQIVSYTNKANPVIWMRYYHKDSSGDFTWGEWICTFSLTGQKVLWGGDRTSGWYMTSGHTATLTELVSKQHHGIVLVFSYYNGAEDTNYSWQSFFVHKYMVTDTGRSHTFTLNTNKFGYVGAKYLSISNSEIVGHDENDDTGTAASGITYANNKFVLRYVLGV